MTYCPWQLMVSLLTIAGNRWILLTIAGLCSEQRYVDHVDNVYNVNICWPVLWAEVGGRARGKLLIENVALAILFLERSDCFLFKYWIGQVFYWNIKGGKFSVFDCLVLLGHKLEYIFYFFSCKAILGWRCDGGVKKKKRESSILILAPV